MCAQVCAACPSGGRVGGRGREGRGHTHTHICRHMYILQLALYVYTFLSRTLINDISIWVWDPLVCTLSWEPSMLLCMTGKMWVRAV